MRKQKEGTIKKKAMFALMLGLALLLPDLAQARLQVGNQAPDFTIPDTAWVNHSLSQYRGQVVLLMFWQAF
jgi:hypothetical protein